MRNRAGIWIRASWTRTGLLTLAVGVLVAGCGQHHTERVAVAAYLQKVNKIELALARPLATVTKTGNAFAQEQRAGGSLTNLVYVSNEQALLKAWSQIEALRGRLAAIITPPPAGRLRSLLLQITDGQARLTRELAQLVAFLPGYSEALRPLGPATRRLQLALSQQTAIGSANVAAAYASKAAALHRFQTSLDGVLARLRQLRPPPVSSPDYEGEIAAVRGMSTAAGRLAGALEGGPHGNISQLLAQFDRAATSNQTVAAQKARIAAVRAYDGQSTRLFKLTQAAERERLRLANNLS
jgi:hypothetical protein